MERGQSPTTAGKRKFKKRPFASKTPIPMLSRYELNVLQAHVKELAKLSHNLLVQLDHPKTTNIGRLFLESFNTSTEVIKENIARQFIDYINHSDTVVLHLKAFQEKSLDFRTIAEVFCLTALLSFGFTLFIGIFSQSNGPKTHHQ
jgi:hypothetical protein